jgi:hypothetical protein
VRTQKEREGEENRGTEGKKKRGSQGIIKMPSGIEMEKRH